MTVALLGSGEGSCKHPALAAHSNPISRAQGASTFPYPSANSPLSCAKGTRETHEQGQYTGLVNSREMLAFKASSEPGAEFHGVRGVGGWPGLFPALFPPQRDGEFPVFPRAQGLGLSLALHRLQVPSPRTPGLACLTFLAQRMANASVPHTCEVKPCYQPLLPDGETEAQNY